MADIDLPLWPLDPNWSDPVTERLSWLTDVMISRSGAEQRRKVRLSPRREFEYKVSLSGNVRSYFDQLLHRISETKLLLPLWIDKNKLTANAVAGTHTVFVPTAFTEFVVGGTAVLWRDPFHYQVVVIDQIFSDRLHFTDGLIGNWPKGSVIYPARPAYMDPEVSMQNLTSRVGEATVTFQLDGANDYDTGEEVLPMYGTYPLITLEMNRREDLETQYHRTMEELDGQVGRIRRYDEVGRSFQTQFYNWMAHGREQHHLLRQSLYRLSGRQKAFWLPSFNEDFTLAADLDTGGNTLDIQQIGYRALGGVVAGRDRAMVLDTDLIPHVVTISGTLAGLHADEERLVLSAPTTFDLKAGTTGSFVSPMRLENDIIEITHHTANDGACEASVACKSFADTRVPTGPFVQERPEAVMNAIPCGDGAPLPYVRFRLEYLGGPTGGRLGEPGLGCWVSPQFDCHDLHGPHVFECYSYGQWNELDTSANGTGTHLEGICVDNYYVEQWVQLRIQDGTGTPGCPRLGDAREHIRLLIHKPGWTYWRAALGAADGGNFEEPPDPNTGIALFQGSGFPGTMYFNMPVGENDPGWAPDYKLLYNEEEHG